MVGETGCEEHPTFRHAGGSGQSGSSNGSAGGEEALGGRQSLGERLPGKCEKHNIAVPAINFIIHLYEQDHLEVYSATLNESSDM